MSQANTGNNNIPKKSKGDRPGKHPLPNNSGENAAPATAPPGFERRVGRRTDLRVGSVVYGFIDAEFDGGYLLTIRGDSVHSTSRGVVYKPGSYVPVSAENDVTPHVPMIRRNEVPDIHGSSAFVPSAPPPPPASNEFASCVNQPSIDALLQAEARCMRLPEMPFEELNSEVVKRIHAPS